jgi:DNA polymerase I-like protein with 3'-5' exonuclease and polymerase domains
MSNASPLDFMQNVGLTQQRETPNIVKPWMKYHRFEVVSTIEKLEWVIQKAFEAKECSLDLETQGLDTRVYLKPVSELESPHEIWWDPASPPALVPQSVHKIVGYCLSYDGITGYYVPVRHTAPGAVNVDLVRAGQLISKLCHAAQPELTTEGLAQDPLGSYLIKTPGKIKLYFWHAKFDQELLYPVTGIDFWHPESYEDGMLLYFVKYTSDKNLDLKQKSLKELFVRDAQGKLVTENNNAIPYEMIKLKELFLKGREIDFPSLHPEEPGVVAYACSDAICTFLHCKKPELISMTRDPKYFPMYRLEKQSAQALRGMERNRVKLDLPYVRSLFAEARIEADGYRNQIVTLASEYGFPDFDPQSPAQLAEFLFKSPSGLKIEPKPEQTPSGQYKTDADTLEKIVLENSGVNPILLVVVKYRQVEKVIGTYLEAMVANCDANDEARVQFKQTGAATGRISAPGGDPKHGYCGFPPHGIPSTYDDKKPKVATCLRQAFIARPGYTMVKVDFAGEELRIVTNLSQEPVWIKEFLEGTGDLHTITAKAFFNKEDITKQERQQGKIANFSLVYGGGVRAIMNATGCNQPEAGRRKLNFDKSMPRFAGWVTLQKKYIHEHKGVKTAFGRWIATPQVDSEDKALVGAAERWSINYPIQGSGADIMKMAMVLLHKEFYRLGWYAQDAIRMLLTVHDEIVFEVKHHLVPEAMPIIEELMTRPGRMARWQVPLEVEPLIDSTWDAKYDYHKILHGSFKPPKDGDKLKDLDLRVGNYIFHKVPAWLEGIVIPDWQREGWDPNAKQQKTLGAPIAGIVTHSTVQVPSPIQAPAQAKVLAPSAPPPTNPVEASAPEKESPPLSEDDIFVYPIYTLTEFTMRKVAAICIELLDDGDCKVLHLVSVKDPGQYVLIDASLGIRVNPESFGRLMRDRGL